MSPMVAFRDADMLCDDRLAQRNMHGVKDMIQISQYGMHLIDKQHSRIGKPISKQNTEAAFKWEFDQKPGGCKYSLRYMCTNANHNVQRE